MATLYSSVLDEIGRRIVDGDPAADTALTLEGIGQEFGVSRTVAREVVQVLVSLGLVESRRRTGVRVLGATHWDVMDPAVLRWRLASVERRRVVHELSEFRLAVEPTAVALAARHATDAQREELRDLAARMEETGSRGELAAFLEHDVAFHRLLLQASGNLQFARMAGMVEEVLRGRTDHDLMPPEPKPEARRLHQMVADAVAEGQPQLAESAMATLCAEVLTEMSDPPA
ncbi:FadR family transcriptional regulator [Nocardioides panacisoli]|uniref:FadR/GntR family transcriptional regulator n=1 Tax=Nocardioides panacisoli TaxID=627624 RepID=UPI001C6276A0|nr:FadR/GntR family transcriptional regulator [Nocardioides panacisoli]QYJ05523.1 FadR family transcriptional regulator [Nocardioides panacisoli]